MDVCSPIAEVHLAHRTKSFHIMPDGTSSDTATATTKPMIDLTPDSSPGQQQQLKIKFISIAGSSSSHSTGQGSSGAGSAQNVAAAMVTPLNTSSIADPTSSSPSLSSRASPSLEVQLLPIELYSFGYSCGASPKNCARIINCSFLAKAASAAASCETSACSDGGSTAPAHSPNINELCSFLIYELQALAVGRSPVRRAYDSPTASPMLSPSLMPVPSAASSDFDEDELRLPSPLHFQDQSPTSKLPQSPQSPQSPATRTPPAPALLLPPIVCAKPLNTSTSAPKPLRGGLLFGIEPTQPPPAQPPSTSATTSPSTTQPKARRVFSVSPASSPLPTARTCGGSDGAHPSSPSAAAVSSSPSPVSPTSRSPTAKLRVGIGCKDGLNVSVSIATYLARQLSDRGLVASARHRELERLAKRAARAQAEVSGTQQGAVRSQGEGV